MYMNSYLDGPLREELAKNNQYTSVTEHEAYSLASAVLNMFQANGIPYEVQQTVHRERTPEASVMVSKKRIVLKIGITRRVTTVTRITPKGGIFDE